MNPRRSPNASFTTLRTDAVSDLEARFYWERVEDPHPFPFYLFLFALALSSRRRLARQLLVSHRGVVNKPGHDGRSLLHVISLDPIEDILV